MLDNACLAVSMCIKNSRIVLVHILAKLTLIKKEKKSEKCTKRQFVLVTTSGPAGVLSVSLR